jgi:hypothetical protein
VPNGWLIGVALFLAAPTAGARPHVSPAQLADLEQGKMLEFSQKVNGSGVMMGKAIGVIPDTPEAVLYVFQDLGTYKAYMPRIKESRAYKRRGPHTFAVLESDLPWPVKDCWASVKFTRYEKPGRVFELKWWMLNGTMKNFTGAALIEPWTTDGRKSVLTYQLFAEPQTAAPDSMISNGVRKVASVFVQRLRLRLQALRKFKKMPKGL